MASYDPFQASSSIRKIIGSGSKKPVSPYVPSRNLGRRKRAPKRFTFDVTMYNNPGDDILARSQIQEKSLTKIGNGSIMLYEDNTAGQVRVELLKMLASFTRSFSLTEEIEFETIEFVYLKKDGRKKQFQKRYCALSFVYDALGVKDIAGKDSKHLYIVLSKFISLRKNNTAQPILHQSSTHDDESDDDDDLDRSPFSSFSTKRNNRLAVFDSCNNGSTSFDLDSSIQSDECCDAIMSLQRKCLNRRKVCDETPDYKILMVAVLLLSHLTDFSHTIEIVLKEKKGSASDIEHAIGQVMLLNTDDKYLWNYALSDLYAELKLHSSIDVVEILNTIFQSLRSLDCELWKKNFFQKLFRSVLLNEYYTENGFNEREEQQDVTLLNLKVQERCHTLEDVFVKFTNGKTVPVPSVYKENVDGDEIWRRQFFQQCPVVLLLGLQWKFNKKRFLELSEKIPANLLEDARSTNRNQYFIGLLVISTKVATYLLVNCRALEKWKIYVNGNMYSLEKNDDILDMFYSLPDAEIDFVMYTNEETVLEKIEAENLKIHGEFLMKRLQERKTLLSEDVIVLKDDETDEGAANSKDQLVKERLKGIFGQFDLKKKIEVLARRAVFNKKRGVSNKNDVSNLHMIFSGNPGTGKTMAARCMAGVFKDLGITKTEKIIEVQRSDLVADHIGGTAKLTEKYLKQAEGGLFFLDEAYRLCSSSDRDYGKEALETIMQRMNANPDRSIQNPIFIFGGYKDEMNKFLQLNPGLPRRIKTNLTFKNFKADELMEITKKKMLEDKRRFPHEIDELFTSCFARVPASVVQAYNAALCKDLIDAIQTQQESRLPLDCTVADLEKFTLTDITSGIEAFLNSPLLKSDTKTREVGTSTSDLLVVEDVERMTSVVEDMLIVPEVTLNIPGLPPIISTPPPFSFS